MGMTHRARKCQRDFARCSLGVSIWGKTAKCAARHSCANESFEIHHLSALPCAEPHTIDCLIPSKEILEIEKGSVLGPVQLPVKQCSVEQLRPLVRSNFKKHKPVGVPRSFRRFLCPVGPVGVPNDSWERRGDV